MGETTKHVMGLEIWREHCRQEGDDAHIPASEGGSAKGDTTWSGYAVCRVSGCGWSAEIADNEEPSDD